MSVRTISHNDGHWIQGLFLTLDEELNFVNTTNPEIDSSGGSLIQRIKDADINSYTLVEASGQDVFKVDTSNRTFTVVPPYELDTETVISKRKFVSEKTSITGSNAGAWVVRSLGLSYAETLIQVTIESTAMNNDVGIREIGSGLALNFPLRGHTIREVAADINGDIEIYSNSNNATFWITGTK